MQVDPDGKHAPASFPPAAPVETGRTDPDGQYFPPLPRAGRTDPYGKHIPAPFPPAAPVKTGRTDPYGKHIPGAHCRDALERHELALGELVDDGADTVVHLATGAICGRQTGGTGRQHETDKSRSAKRLGRFWYVIVNQVFVHVMLSVYFSPYQSLCIFTSLLSMNV